MAALPIKNLQGQVVFEPKPTHKLRASQVWAWCARAQQQQHTRRAEAAGSGGNGGGSGGSSGGSGDNRTAAPTVH
jgi:hypothetical protein